MPAANRALSVRTSPGLLPREPWGNALNDWGQSFYVERLSQSLTAMVRTTPYAAVVAHRHACDLGHACGRDRAYGHGHACGHGRGDDRGPACDHGDDRGHAYDRDRACDHEAACGEVGLVEMSRTTLRRLDRHLAEAHCGHERPWHSPRIPARRLEDAPRDGRSCLEQVPTASPHRLLHAAARCVEC